MVLDRGLRNLFPRLSAL